jgi:F-type H+-transporting ATPase subunit alpha
MENQVIIFFALLNGFLDDVAVNSVSRFEISLYQFLSANYSNIAKTIADTKGFSPEIESALKGALTEFKKSFVA